MEEKLQTKFFLQSKTIIGALVAAISTLLPVMGIDIPPEQVSSWGDAVIASLDALGQLVGLTLVIWGRLTASSKLRVKP